MQKRKANKMDGLKIVEIGAGNGTLMKNILGYLKLHQPDLYNIAQYNIIEISPQLAQSQRKTLQSMPRDAANKVSIMNKSVFDYIPRSRERDDFCFFIAMEVLDNLAHDYVRFDVDTGVPVQGMVLIDEDTGDFEQVYEPVTDSLLKRYLEVSDRDIVVFALITPNSNNCNLLDTKQEWNQIYCPESLSLVTAQPFQSKFDAWRVYSFKCIQTLGTGLSQFPKSPSDHV